MTVRATACGTSSVCTLVSVTSTVGSPLSTSVLASSAVVVSPATDGVSKMIVLSSVTVNLAGQEECAVGQREEGAHSCSVTTPIARVVGRGAIVLLGVRIGSSRSLVLAGVWVWAWSLLGFEVCVLGSVIGFL